MRRLLELCDCVYIACMYVCVRRVRKMLADAFTGVLQLLIFIPRALNGGDIKAAIRSKVSQKVVIEGRPKAQPGTAGTHRPMFLYFLLWDDEGGGSSSGGASGDGSGNEWRREGGDGIPQCAGCFDIPTIISSIWGGSCSAACACVLCASW